MAETKQEVLRPTSLPPIPEDILTSEQWGILAAIADTIVPSIAACRGNRLLQHPLRAEVYQAAAKRVEQLSGVDAGDEVVSKYLGECATSSPEFKENVTRLLSFHMDETKRKGLMTLLNLLNSRAGALFLTGYVTPLDCLHVQTREQILQSWATARLPFFRGVYRSLTSLVKVFWLRTSSDIGPLLGFPKRPTSTTPPTSYHPFEFLQIPPSFDDEPETIDSDVVIVGSGCGGAVAAKTLAEAGLKVFVVDKSYYWPPEHFPMTENDAAVHLFANGGAFQSDDASTTTINGSAWGGGGTINWSASLQTQGYVRREWAQKHELDHFTSSRFQADLDAVCDRMGVGTSAIEHNKTNRVLLEGARKMGWSAKVVPQNTGGEAHDCGRCTLGCGSCGKKGPSETFLPDAAKAGATFIEGFDVQEILFAEGGRSGQKTATGVRGMWTSRDGNGGVAGDDRTRRQVIINANRVIVAAGTTATPLILLHSGLKNRNIGRNLQQHPASLVAAVWEDEVKPWEGPILTSVVNEFEDLDGQGHGVKLEATTMLPAWFLPFFPWQSGQAWKKFVLKMRRMTGYISLGRCRYTGRVYPDPQDGRCRIQYSLDKAGKAHVLEGVARLAELLYVEGAQEIHTAVPGVPPFVRPSPDAAKNVTVTPIAEPSSDDGEFKSWLAKLRAAGFPAPDSGFAAAHQMGTCRMGTKAKSSVVDPRGKVWDTTGLYVCDTSVFPSASGANPMITCMGISRGIARGIVEESGKLGQVKAKM